MDRFVARAAHVADSVSHARSRRAFLTALADFEEMLKLAPGYPPGYLKEDDGAALQALADIVIDEVEQRLDARSDRPAVQRELASRIYHIREDLESLHARLIGGAAEPSSAHFGGAR